ncbi:MAG TPA: PAS domain S-box protein, partial [Candidatus Desulfofervidus auxilii]|nr:PAS domain S-box protein [Candidatus Desulfofervidus auxilii]
MNFEVLVLKTFYNLSTFVAFLDKNGKVVFINRSPLKLLGYKKEEIIGRLFWECGWFDKQRQVVKENFYKALNGQRVEWEAWVKGKGDKNIVPVLTTLFPIKEEDKVIGVGAEGREIGALKSTEERYRLLFEQNTDAILLVNEKTKIVIANNAFYKLVNEEEVKGNSILKYIAEEDRRKFFSYFKKRQTIPFRCTFRLLTSSKESKEIDCKIVLLPDKKTSLAVLRDMTPLVEAETLFHALAENAPIGVFFIEENGLSYVNPELARIFETIPENLIGKNPLKFIAPASKKVVKRKIKDKLSGHIMSDHYEFQGLTAKGRVITCEARSQTIAYKGKWAIVGSVIDVTERKKQEEELIKAKEEALSANRAKTAFLANMSHEMRTPLNAILGFTELLAETQLTPQQREYVETILNSVKHLSDLIGQVLDISQIEAGIFKLEKKPCSLKRLIEEVSSIIRQRALAKGLKFRFSFRKGLPEQILTDPLRLRQALLNLLHNALKYTEKGYISLTVTSQDKKLVFTVKDTGCGISKEVLPHIFERFLRFEKKEGGLGLGLSITKEVIEKLGGEIKVKSELGKGTIFKVILPIEEVKKEEVILPIDALIVEPNVDTAEVISSYLYKRGLRTQILKWDKQSFKTINKFAPSFILLDFI